MSTPRALVDVDIHPVFDPQCLARRLPQPWKGRVAAGNLGPGTMGYWNPNGVRRRDAVTEDGAEIASDPQTLRERYLDVLGITYGVLNLDGPLFTLSPEYKFAAAMATAANDLLVEEWLAADARFLGSAIIAPGDPQAAAEEIHRVGGHPQIVQVLLPSGATAPYGHPFYHPIYEAAQAQDLAIGIHPGTEGVGIAGAPYGVGYPSSYLEWHTGLVASFVNHLVSLVSEGVFVRFPRLQVVLIEAGVSWLGPLLWRFDKNWKSLRMTVPWLTTPPSETVASHCYLTTQPLEEPTNRRHLANALELFPAEEMLLFSSDYPHWDGDVPDFSAAALPREWREKVLYGNAARLYHLPELVVQ